MTERTPTYEPGDLVELVSVPPGRNRRLKVGQRGRVLVGSAGTAFGWLSVAFRQDESDVHLLSPRHVKLIARAPRETDDADDE
jgi:hypothetical protein